MCKRPCDLCSPVSSPSLLCGNESHFNSGLLYMHLFDLSDAANED